MEIYYGMINLSGKEKPFAIQKERYKMPGKKRSYISVTPFLTFVGKTEQSSNLFINDLEQIWDF